MKKCILIFGAALSLFSTEALAQELDFQLRLGSQIATDESFDALQDSNLLPYTTLQFGYAATEGSLQGLRLFLSYDSTTNAPNERLSGSLELDWTRYRFMVGGEYGIMLWNMFRPLAGVGVGYALGDMTVTADDVRSDFTHDVAAEAFAGLDFTIRIATFDSGHVLRFKAGTRIGYQLQTEARFDELESDASGWNRGTNDLGVLDTDGMFWNLGAGLSLAF